MDFLKALNEKAKKALDYVLGDRDPAEFFKGTSDDVGKLVVGLLEKAAEWAERIDALEAKVEKAEGETKPTGFAAILAKAEDPDVRAYLETQHAAIEKQGGDITALQKARRRDEIEAFTKSLEALPNPDDAVVVVLEKAADAGFDKELRAVLVSANEQAKLGKAFEELGLEVPAGESMDAAGAHEALVAKAAEIRKADSNLTAEKAYEQACEENPDLFNATRVYRPSEGATH